MDDTTRVIRLEVSLAGESLTGCASDDLGGTRRFDGRLGLLAAIDTLIAGSAPGAEQEEPVEAVRYSDAHPGEAERPGAAEGTR